MRQLDKLDEAISGFDAFLITGNSEDNKDLYYLTGFRASDPFIYIRKDGESSIIVSGLEHGRALKESIADNVENINSYREDGDERFDALARILKEKDIGNVAVQDSFPLGTARELGDRGFDLDTVDNPITSIRSVKTEEEMEKLSKAQEATENAMMAAENMIKSSEVKDGKLYYGGEELTSEAIRTEIKIELLKQGCELNEPIAASGKDSANPHVAGSGPVNPGEPVVIDIFPSLDMYHGDMTRTFAKGEPEPEVRDMYDAVLEAQEAALEMIEPGVKASAVHDKVCDILEEHGYETTRDNAEEGFIHSTGHGVGLDLHESPSLGTNETELEKGNVVTVEPGLYLKEYGGVRIEDMVAVTDKGCRNFNVFHKRFEV